MKKLLLTMTAIPAFALAVPATAQVNVNANGAAGIQNRIVQMQTRIDAGIRAGTITQSEAQALRVELRQLSRLERRYSRNGLTQAERQDLQARIRDLRQDIRLADGRGGRWNDDDDNYGQGGPVDAEAAGWVIDDNCGNAGGGIGGLFSGIFGGNNCMRVGQRLTGNLYAVPYELRDTFRDGNNVFFRFDGRARIYEVDARTNTVLRVWTRDDD
jgi:hypothetical protein